MWALLARTLSAHAGLKSWRRQLTNKMERKKVVNVVLSPFCGYRHSQLKGKDCSFQCSLFSLHYLANIRRWKNEWMNKRQWNPGRPFVVLMRGLGYYDLWATVVLFIVNFWWERETVNLLHNSVAKYTPCTRFDWIKIFILRNHPANSIFTDLKK